MDKPTQLRFEILAKRIYELETKIKEFEDRLNRKEYGQSRVL